MEFTLDQARAFRIQRQYLADNQREDVTALVSNVCGIQSQLHSAAELAIGVRQSNAEPGDIRQALYEDKSLIKSSCMRETLHLIPSAEFSLFMQAQRSYRIKEFRRRLERFGVDWSEYEKIMSQARELLLQKGPMTRPEIVKHMESNYSPRFRDYTKVAWSPFRGAVIEGLICYGPQKGNKTCFAAVEDWHSEMEDIKEVSAQSILLKKYLRSNGPATKRDFSHWMGIPGKNLQAAWEKVRDDIVPVEREGKEYYVLKEDIDILRQSDFAEPRVNLLPYFDNYLLSLADKSQIMDMKYYKDVFRAAGWVSPVILVNGQVVGVWSSEKRRGRVDLTYRFFEKRPKGLTKVIKGKAQKVRNFLGQ